MTPEERVAELKVYMVVPKIEVVHIVRKAMQDCAKLCDGVQHRCEFVNNDQTINRSVMPLQSIAASSWDDTFPGRNPADACADLIRKEIVGE